MGQEMSKYYAVANGYQTGIFRTWEETKPLVNGYSGAKYKSFKTLEEAQQYLNGTTPDKVTNPLYSNTNGSVPPKPAVSNLLAKDIFGQDNRVIIAYTDGSCVNQVGGYGYLVIRNNKISPVCGKVPTNPCTNQIAELYAIYSVIFHILQYHKDEIVRDGVIIYTDSKYSMGCLTTWYHNWKRNGWINSKGQPVANKELIQAILQISVGLKIIYHHVKAHNGDQYNEWADRLANDGRRKV